MNDNSSAKGLPSAIGQPAMRALTAEGITQLSQITKYSEKEIIQLHGVGPKAIRILREELAKHGLHFAD